MASKRSRKREAKKRLAQPRHDAAADEHRACTQGQRHIAREAAEQGAEVGQRAAAAGVAGQRGADQLLGRQDLRRSSLGQRHGLVQQGKSDAREQAFGRHMGMPAARMAQDLALEVIGRGQRGMAAFSGQTNPAHFGLDDGAHAQAGAGADHGQGTCRHRRRAMRTPLRGRQTRQRQGQGLEVVEHLQRLQTEFGLQFGNGKSPGAVGQFDPVTAHRGGHGDGRTLRSGGGGQVRQIAAHRLGKAGRPSHRELAHLFDAARRILDPAEAGIGAADIGHQPGQGRGG